METLKEPVTLKQCKEYSYQELVCGNAMSDPGHTKFHGHRYCPMHVVKYQSRNGWLKNAALKKINTCILYIYTFLLIVIYSIYLHFSLIIY